MPIEYHLPAITCAMLRPHTWMKSNELLFEFPRYVNKIDIKNYLESMYSIKVLKVNTVVPPRTRSVHPKQYLFHKHPSVTTYVWETMRKKAYVTIDGEFKFPARHEIVEGRYQQTKEKKDQDIEKRIESIRLFRDRWHEVVEERYMDGQVSKLEDEMCGKLDKPLENLTLDDLALVKGSAKNRVHLTAKGRARREGKVYNS